MHLSISHRREIPVCPVCLATAAWIAVATVSTGGMTALLLKRAATTKAANNIPTNEEDHHG